MENWDDLKYVLAVYRNGGLSAAARDLKVNHATVSRRIATLEEKLAVRIFDRFPDGMQPTANGLELVKSAKAIENHIQNINLSISGKDSDLAGPLRVSAQQLIIQHHLADILMDFQKSYPLIELNIITSFDAVNFAQREADVSIWACNEPEGNLWGWKILSNNCGYYGNKNYLRNCNSTTELSCLNFQWRGDQPAEEVLAKYPNANVIAKFNDMVSVHGAVMAGMGIARMPCFMAENDENLERVPFLDIQPYGQIWALTHPNLKKVTRITTFMRFVSKALKEKEKYFLGNNPK